VDEKKKVAIIVGDINLDLDLCVSELPAPGDDASVRSVVWAVEAQGSNAAIALHELGARPRLVGRVGQDLGAKRALQIASSRNLDLAEVQVDPDGTTGLCAVLVTPNGERSLLSFRGANAALDPACARPSLVADAALVYVSAYALLEGTQAVAATRIMNLASRRVCP